MTRRSPAIDASTVTSKWLREIPITRISPMSPTTIGGIIQRSLKIHLDGRGEVTELWSEPWMGDGFLRPAHIYQSSTDAGVVKGWHLHQIHTDQFVVTRGKLQVNVIDIRAESPTFGHVNAFFCGSLNPLLVKIPPGLLHGWKALSGPEVQVFNLQSHVYDGDDEFKFPWDSLPPDLWQPQNG